MNNPHKMRTGMDRVLHAFGYSMQGLSAAVRFESAFRQEAALAVVLLPAAFWLGRSWVEVALLTGSVLLVMVEGYGYQEAADIIGCPAGTLSSRFVRGRDALHRLLEGEA